MTNLTNASQQEGQPHNTMIIYCADNDFVNQIKTKILLPTTAKQKNLSRNKDASIESIRPKCTNHVSYTCQHHKGILSFPVTQY